MSIEQSKKQIEQYIEEIKGLDLKRLSPNGAVAQSWNNLTESDIEKIVDDTVETLNVLKQHLDLIDGISFNLVNSIQQHLERFLSQFHNFDNIDSTQITNHHHNPLSQLNNLNNILRSTGLYNQLRLAPDLKKLERKFKKAESLSNNLLSKESDLENATKTLTSYLESKTDVQKKALKEYAVTFNDRAEENKFHRNEKFLNFKISGSWWWLLGSFLFGLSVLAMTAWFTINFSDDLSFSQYLIKISTLIVPIYFTVFCSQQYIHHKRMYEIYVFKETATNTMNKLRDLTADDITKERILDKGLKVIFNEPSAKQEKGLYDKQLVSELISMLKDQIK